MYIYICQRAGTLASFYELQCTCQKYFLLACCCNGLCCYYFVCGLNFLVAISFSLIQNKWNIPLMAKKDSHFEEISCSCSGELPSPGHLCHVELPVGPKGDQAYGQVGGRCIVLDTNIIRFYDSSIKRCLGPYNNLFKKTLTEKITGHLFLLDMFLSSFLAHENCVHCFNLNCIVRAVFFYPLVKVCSLLWLCL